MIRYLLTKIFIPKILSKSCPDRIPRTGSKAEKINCYIVALDKDDSPYFIALKADDKKLYGDIWDGTSYKSGGELTWEEFNDYKLRITHYYGIAEVWFDSIFRYLWHTISKHVYIEIQAKRKINELDQYFFNKKKLVTKKRIELLQFMIEDQVNRTHNGINSFDLMTKLYSVKWVMHPTEIEQNRKLELYLDSLVKSGELEKVNNEYVVSGVAIQTIEKYEEEERKHVEAVKLQKKMLYLTIIVAAMAIIQAGVVKLPTLIDFSNQILK
jgi:hypothetical protein